MNDVADRASCASPLRLQLPWLVNGRLAPAESAELAAHLRECAACRADLELERALAARVAAEPTVSYAPAASLNALLAAIDRLPAAAPGEPTPAVDGSTADAGGTPRRRVRASRGLLIAAVAAQALAVAGLVGVLYARAPAASYRTLSTPSALPSRPALRVVFAPELPVGEVARLLGGIGAGISDGPSDAGVYTVVIEPGRSPAEALAVLRADPRVRFAEPVAGSGPQAAR